MAHGFVTSRPLTNDGATYTGIWGSGYITASKFAAPGVGTLDVSELGLWGSGYSAYDGNYRIGLFAEDNANNCPESLVANGEATATVAFEGEAVYIACYATVTCSVTGGSTYWLSVIPVDSGGRFDRITAAAAVGNGIYKSGVTFPTWPTGTEWETHSDYNFDHDFWAVYSAGAAASVMPSKRFQNTLLRM